MGVSFAVCLWENTRLFQSKIGMGAFCECAHVARGLLCQVEGRARKVFFFWDWGMKTENATVQNYRYCIGWGLFGVEIRTLPCVLCLKQISVNTRYPFPTKDFLCLQRTLSSGCWTFLLKSRRVGVSVWSWFWLFDWETQLESYQLNLFGNENKVKRGIQIREKVVIFLAANGSFWRFCFLSTKGLCQFYVSSYLGACGWSFICVCLTLTGAGISDSFLTNYIRYLAAKSYYFGVGGNMRDFKALVLKNDTFAFNICKEISDGMCFLCYWHHKLSLPCQWLGTNEQLEVYNVESQKRKLKIRPQRQMYFAATVAVHGGGGGVVTSREGAKQRSRCSCNTVYSNTVSHLFQLQRSNKHRIACCYDFSPVGSCSPCSCMAAWPAWTQAVLSRYFTGVSREVMELCFKWSIRTLCMGHRIKTQSVRNSLFRENATLRQGWGSLMKWAFVANLWFQSWPWHMFVDDKLSWTQIFVRKENE